MFKQNVNQNDKCMQMADALNHIIDNRAQKNGSALYTLEFLVFANCT